MEKRRNLLATTLMLLFASLANCGGGSAGVADAGGADTRPIPPADDAKVSPSDAGGFSASSTQSPSQLTTVEKQALCDQIVANQGGYGRVVQCGGSTQTTDTSQAAGCSDASSGLRDTGTRMKDE